MSGQWKRCAVRALAAGAAMLVAACGSGTIESQFHPSRIVVFGDGFSDIGQAGSRYTVNDGATNVWTLQLASDFGLPLTPSTAGGTSYATGNVRITAEPDAAGSSATLTVKKQIDAFLAGGGVGANDLVVVSGGIGDLIAETVQLTAGGQTRDQLLADVGQAGRDLGAQVRRVVNAGATHVIVVGPYNLGRSPWAAATGQGTLLTDAATRFNDQLLVSIVDLGAKVLYVDAAFYYNLMIGSPGGYDMTNATDPVCTSFDPGVGIGTGTGQLNSALCTTASVVSTDYNRYLFADRVYSSPQAHRKFGDYAATKVHDRW